MEENQEIAVEPERREEGQEAVKSSDDSGQERPEKVDSPPESVGNQNKKKAIGLLTRGQG